MTGADPQDLSLGSYCHTKGLDSVFSEIIFIKKNFIYSLIHILHMIFRIFLNLRRFVASRIYSRFGLRPRTKSTRSRRTRSGPLGKNQR